MIHSILTNEEVKVFLHDIITKENVNNKIIPNRINGEKISNKEYVLYVCLDAIIKYSIIIDSYDLLERFLDRLKMIIRKVSSHNDIVMGINKLIIKMCSIKLDIHELEEYQNKKILVDYIYDKYIVNGYFYCGIPSILNDDNYYPTQDIIEINKILKKYKINLFLDERERLVINDSFFITCFYSNNLPLYLKKICDSIYSGTSKKFDYDSYLLRNYRTSIKNIEFVVDRIGISNKDKSLIFNFFNNEWKRLQINSKKTLVGFIKRSYFNKNSLKNYDSIINKLDNNDIYVSVSKILESNYNEELIIKIPSSEFIIFEIPSVSSYYEKSKEEDFYYEEAEKIKSNDLNEYGNATVVALLGVFFISMGITLMIIMMGG